MLDTMGETGSAVRIEKAVQKGVKERHASLSAGKMGFSTSEVGDMVTEAL